MNVPFNQLRSTLIETPVLAYSDSARLFIIDTDASNMGVGTLLSQDRGHGEQVVAYYNRALSKPEHNCCITRRELLAVVLGLRYFCLYLHGQKFGLRTNHMVLTWLLNFKELEGQLARWSEVLQEYNLEVRDRAGRLHSNADALLM